MMDQNKSDIIHVLVEQRKRGKIDSGEFNAIVDQIQSADQNSLETWRTFLVLEQDFEGFLTLVLRHTTQENKVNIFFK